MKKIKIILADDHNVVREGIREMLQNEEDMEVIGEASEGEEAVKMVSYLNPDIVLMDISMPGMDGIEATRKIKESNPFVNVLVLSAYDNEEFIFSVLEAKAAGYLLKNAKRQELVNAIRLVFNGESFLHPRITKKVLERLQTGNRKKTNHGKKVLSIRELEIVNLGAKGLFNKEIAAELSLSERTVQTHWRNIFTKLGVGSRIEAIMECLNKELISIENQPHG